MTERRPLENRRILVTRPAGQGKDLAALLRRLGAEVRLIPTIAIEPLIEGEAVQDAVARIGSFDLLVFTSANGARCFADALDRHGGGRPGGARRVAAVGPGTARALRERGIETGIVASDSDAEGLAAKLLADVRAGCRVLWIRPESARDVLPRALRAVGALVTEVVVYRTVAAQEAPAAAAAVERGDVDAVAFTSPSSFRGLLESASDCGRLAEGLARARRVAIGRVTAAAMAEAGFAADAVAGRASDEGIVEALISVLGEGNR